MSNENKKIEDYLHLYLGCEAQIEFKPEYVLSIPPNWEDGLHEITGLHLDYVNGFKSCKPILRPLSDMTDYEKLIILLNYRYPKVKFESNENAMNCWRELTDYSPEEFQYLLKQGFDLFRLIESGLAIDKTTLNVTPS